MRRLNCTALLGSMLAGVVVGCGGEETEPLVEAPPPAPQVELRSLLADTRDSRLVATVRGPGQVGYLQPRPTRDGGDMVTNFLVQNISNGALAGFKVDEFWYDNDGETVTGGSFRMQLPFLEDDVIEVIIRTPRDPRMARSNYEFSHQNGVVEANLFDEIEALPVEDAEDADQAETPAR